MSACREHIYNLLQGSLLKKDLSGARRAHFLMVSHGLDSVSVLCDHLIRLFSLCGQLFEATLVFCNVSQPSSFTWQASIYAHVVVGENNRAIQLYHAMHASSDCTETSKFVLSCVLKACSGMGRLGEEEGRHIHSCIVKSGLDSDVVMGSALIDMYAKCGNAVEAMKLFNRLPSRNVVSWGAILTCYMNQEAGFVALELFEKMQREHIEPDHVALLCILKACGTVQASKEGRIIHEMVVKRGYEKDSNIGNTVVDMYARCGSLDEACKSFHELQTRNIVSYGAMIAGYAQFGHGFLALDLYDHMQLNDMEPNKAIFVSIVKACGVAKTILEGMLVHGQIIDSSFETDVLIGSALIDMYSRCGSHEEACKVLYDLPNRDVISWSAVISGYAQDGQGFSALGLFARMQKEGIKPDNISILSALKCCANVGAIVEGRLIHKELIRNGAVNDLIIGNTLVDMYAKCGCLEDSWRALQSLENHDIVTWNAMISGYAQQGRCILANECFINMQRHGLEPDDKTYTSILAGCSHAGLLDQGHDYFNVMIKQLGMVNFVEIYGCMVDLLGRSGCLDEAVDLLHTIPTPPDVVLWKSLFTSCRTYNNKELGKWVFDQILDLGLNDGFGYVLMSNMYADDNYANMWEVLDKVGAKEKIGSMV